MTSVLFGSDYKIFKMMGSILIMCLLLPLSNGQIGSSGQISQTPQAIQSGQNPQSSGSQSAQGTSQGTQINQGPPQGRFRFSRGFMQGLQVSQGIQTSKASQGGSQGVQSAQGSSQASQMPQTIPSSQGVNQAAQRSQGVSTSMQSSQGGNPASKASQFVDQGVQNSQGGSQSSQMTQSVRQGVKSSQGGGQSSQMSTNVNQGVQSSQGGNQALQMSQGISRGMQRTQGSSQTSQMSQGVQSTQGGSQTSQMSQGVNQGVQSIQGGSQTSQMSQGVNQGVQSIQGGSQTSQMSQGVSQGAQSTQVGNQASQMSQSVRQIVQSTSRGSQASQMAQGIHQGIQTTQGGSQASQISQGVSPDLQSSQGGSQASQTPQGIRQGIQSTQGGTQSQGLQSTGGGSQSIQMSQGVSQGIQSAQGGSQVSQMSQGTRQGAQTSQGWNQGSPKMSQFVSQGIQRSQVGSGAAQTSRGVQTTQQTSQISQGVRQGIQNSQGGNQALHIPQGVNQGVQSTQTGNQAFQNSLGMSKRPQISQGANSQKTQMSQSAQLIQTSQSVSQGNQMIQGAAQRTQTSRQGGQIFQNSAQSFQGDPQWSQSPQVGTQGAQFPQISTQRSQSPSNTAVSKQSGAQSWQSTKLMEIERRLEEFKKYIEYLESIIYKERLKYPAPYTHNLTTHPLNLPSTNFIDDVETRLSSMKQITSNLVQHITNCPRGPLLPPSPQNLLIQSETVKNSSNIFATWDSPDVWGNQIVKDNLHYKVYFAPADQYGRQTDGEFIFRICDANFTQSSVTDLSPSSYYTIKVATTLCKPAESEGPPTIIKTLDIIPSAPLNLKLLGTRSDALAVSWEPPMVKGSITRYTIYVTEGSSEPMVVKVDPSQTQYAIYNLYDGTTYVVRMTASSDNGESPQSAPLEVTTNTYIPMPPRNLRAVDNNQTSVTLAWDAPEPGTGRIKGYNVKYTTDSSFRTFQEIDIPDPSITTATVTDLIPFTTYFFQVFAATMRRIGDGSVAIMTTTKAYAPTEPMSVRKQIRDNGLQTVHLSWLPPEKTYGSINEYILRWGVQGGALRKEVLTPYVLSWESDFLDDNTTHNFSLSAVNSEGEGKSVNFSIRTKPKAKIIPPNIKAFKTTPTTLKLTWGTPSVPVDGFWILYRKQERVFSGRWQLKEILDPNVREAEISVQKDTRYLLVVKGFKRPRQSTPNVTSQRFAFSGQPAVRQQQSNTWI